MLPTSWLFCDACAASQRQRTVGSASLFLMCRWSYGNRMVTLHNGLQTQLSSTAASRAACNAGLANVDFEHAHTLLKWQVSFTIPQAAQRRSTLQRRGSRVAQSESGSGSSGSGMLQY